MKKKIFLNITITSIVGIILSFFLSTGVIYHSLLEDLKINVKNEALVISNYLNEGKNINDLILDESRVTLIDVDGSVIFDSAYDKSKLDNHNNRPEIIACINNNYGEIIRHSSSLKEDYYYYAVKLDNNQIIRISNSTVTVIGYLIPSIKIIFLLAIAMIVICFYIANKQTKNIIKPINNLDLNNPLSNETYGELKPLLDNLVLHNQMRKEFSANVSHELKTPLTSISGYAEIMANGLVKQEDIVNFAGKIYSESQHLIKLINDIINLSKLDEGQVNLEFKDVDLKELIISVCNRLEIYSHNKNVHITTCLKEVHINGIKSILDELIYNIVQNAIKYNVDGGVVDISLMYYKKNVVLKILDTGIGISEEDLPRIFERFYRVDKSHTSKIEGTGLGLAICKHAVLMHNGTIEVKSKLNVGTTFIITFKRN